LRSTVSDGVSLVVVVEDLGARSKSEADMKGFGIFLAGFAGGWIVRSTVDSSRGLAVAGVSTVYGALERLRTVLAIEREHLEDLVAEGRTKHEADRLKDGRSSLNVDNVDGLDGAALPRPADISRHGRAA
jgi:hypothetical protein